MVATAKRLLVVVPDRVSDLLAKGEYQPRYYNPGEFFDEVHLLLMNDDRPAGADLRHIVGRARVVVHNFQPPTFDETWFRPRWLRKWSRQAVDIAATIAPALVRAYGHHASTFAAAEIKRRLRVPLVVSLHGNPDVDYLRGRLAATWRQRLEGWMSRAYEIECLRAADMVLPVYSPIVPFLRSIGVRRYEIVHNAVGYGITPRGAYGGKDEWRALCVGRQAPGQKNPAAIIEAVSEFDNVTLDVVGDGPLHEELKALAHYRGAADRVRFHRTMENARVLDLVQQCDLFVYQSDNYEISKGTMEAALAGAPVILNRRSVGVADEIREGPFILVDGSASGYQAAMHRVIDDHALREQVGHRTAAYAWARWNPLDMEARVVAIYRALTSSAIREQ